MADNGAGPNGVVVVIGTCGSGKSLLAGSVARGLPEECRVMDVGACTASVWDWDIYTKYYTATAEVWELSVVDGAGDAEPLEALHATVAALAASPEIEDGRIQAIVMVADLTVEGVVTGVEMVLAAAAPLEAEVVIVAGTKADLSASDPGVADELDSWCRANFIEFVAVDPRMAVVEDALHKGRQDGGVGRVIEALETHMWPNMVMGGGVRPPRPAQPSEAPPTALVAGDDGGGNGGDGKNDGATPDPLADYDFDGVATRIASAFSEDAVVGGSDDALFGIPSPLDSEMNGFAELDTGLKMLAEMRDNIQSLPDDQRREAAAKMALALFAQLGSDDEDDEAADGDPAGSASSDS